MLLLYDKVITCAYCECYSAAMQLSSLTLESLSDITFVFDCVHSAKIQKSNISIVKFLSNSYVYISISVIFLYRNFSYIEQYCSHMYNPSQNAKGGFKCVKQRMTPLLH